MFPWHADKTLTPSDAGGIAKEAFGLNIQQVKELGSGWDYFNFLADDEWVLRFPKREEQSELLVREKTILDKLNQSNLSLLVPDMEHIAGPTDDFPWQFAAYRYLSGSPLSSLERSEVSMPQLAETMGQFLAELHRVELELDTPWDDEPEIDWMRREFQAAIDAYPVDIRRRVEELLNNETPRRPDLPQHLVHGDLHPDHILINPDTGKVGGVIDWADSFCSFRSIDFVGICYVGGLDMARRVCSYYGSSPSDEELRWLRCAVAGECIGQIYYGWHDHKPHLVAEGLNRIPLYLD